MAEQPNRVTDSPWFWIILFVCGGLVILTVATPQINRRQRRLDLQFRARQEAGQTVRHDTQDAEPRQPDASHPDDTLVPVAPLITMLALALAVLLIAYWTVQIRRYRREHVSSEGNPADGHDGGG